MEEKDFRYTRTLSDVQKKLYRLNLGISIEDIQKIHSLHDLKALKLGFSIQEVLSRSISEYHISAVEKGHPLQEVRTKTEFDVYKLLYNMDDESTAGCKTTQHLQGIQAGFKPEDVLSDKFCRLHLVATNKGHAASSISGLTGMQVEGVLVGFSPDEVQSEWYSATHVRLANTGIKIDQLRGLSYQKCLELEISTSRSEYQAYRKLR